MANHPQSCESHFLNSFLESITFSLCYFYDFAAHLDLPGLLYSFLTDIHKKSVFYMATRKFKTNPTILFLCFKYLSARDPNASILREAIEFLRGITVIHNKWNEKSLVDVLFFGQDDSTFDHILKIILDSKEFKNYHFYWLFITCEMSYSFLTKSSESFYCTTLACLCKFILDILPWVLCSIKSKLFSLSGRYFVIKILCHYIILSSRIYFPFFYYVA